MRFVQKLRSFLTLCLSVVLLTISAITVSSYIYNYSNHWPNYVYSTLLPFGLLIALFGYLVKFYAQYFMMYNTSKHHKLPSTPISTISQQLEKPDKFNQQHMILLAAQNQGCIENIVQDYQVVDLEKINGNCFLKSTDADEPLLDYELV